MIAKCSSDRCTRLDQPDYSHKKSYFKPVIKHNVLKYQTLCPDCGSVLRWVKPTKGDRVHIAQSTRSKDIRGK